MTIRGIRGAVDVPRNTRAEILSRTRELLLAMTRENRVRAEDVAAAFFTATPDLDAGFPASAIRKIGGGEAWARVPAICSVEIGVKGGMERVVRVMLLVNSDVPPDRIRHQFLGGARCLRPDLARIATRSADPPRRRRKSPNSKASGRGRR